MMLYLCASLAMTTILYEEGGYIYEGLSDPLDPTRADYEFLQDFLQNSDRPYLNAISRHLDGSIDSVRYDLRVRNFRLIKEGCTPISGIDHFAEGSKRCIVSYASYNADYPEKLERLRQALKDVNFQGDFLYRIGGWPDTEGGSIIYAHVPYSFKLCMIREAKRLGYNSILWIDSPFVPLQNFDILFDIIELEGYFFADLPYRLDCHMSQTALKALELSSQELRVINETVGGIFGLSMSHPTGIAIFDAFEQETGKLYPFLSSRPEQLVFSTILYRLQLPHTETFSFLYSSDPKQFNNQTLFYLKY